MNEPISIAIETTCRLGGAALGAGDELIATAGFDASCRHATQLVWRLAEMLAEAHLSPDQLQEVYVAAGPGSFTGSRIGVTVARTLAQALPALRCVGVWSPEALAEGARELPWQHLGVVLDAREGLLYAACFHRRDGAIAADGEPGVMSPAEFLARAARPIVLIGEGLAHHDLTAPGVTIPQPGQTDGPPHQPTPEAVWRVGRRLAKAGLFTDYLHLLPIYSRKPEALRA